MTSLDCGAFPPLLFFLLNVPKLVPKRVRVHKPDAQAKDTPLCETTSRNKRLREWFELLDPSLARQACRLGVVTLRLSRSNRATKAASKRSNPNLGSRQE